MSRLAVSLTFLVALSSSSIAFADVAPFPQPEPTPEPAPEPAPEPTPPPEVEAPAPAEQETEAKAEAKTEAKTDAKADAKADDKAGKCSVTDQGDAILGLAALCLLLSGAALRRRG